MRRKVCAIYGLGGIGKTQLAVEFARTNHTKFSSICWLDGSSQTSLVQSFAEMAQRLPQKDLMADGVETLEHSLIHAEAMVQKCLQWLSLSSNQHWLLIFDNVDRGHDKASDAQAYKVEDYFPTADHGSILITTRLASMRHLGSSFEVGVVGDEQARAILENAANKQIAGKAIQITDFGQS